jgi:hypothetical protein
MAQVPIGLARDLTEPLFATARVLPYWWRFPLPGLRKDFHLQQRAPLPGAQKKTAP